MEKKGIAVTPEQAKGLIIALGISADLDIKLSLKRRQILETLKGMGVPFNNIQDAWIKVHKVAKVYPRTFNSKTGKTDYQPFQSHLNSNAKWAHDIRRFMVWVKATYVSYDKLKADVVVTDSDKKKKEMKRISGAWKTVSTFLADVDDVAVQAQLRSLSVIIADMTK